MERIEIKSTNLNEEIVNIIISYNSNIVLTEYSNFNIIVYISKIFKSLAMTIILKSIGNTVKPIIK